MGFQSTRKFFISFGLCSAVLFAGRMILAPGRLGSPMPGGFVGILERLVSAGPYGVSAILFSHLDRLQSLATSFHQGSFSSIFVALSLAAVTAYCLHQLANGSNTYCNIEYRPALVLVGIGTVLMLVAYLPFALNLDRWPPTQIVSGRLSGVHLGAAIGYAVVWCGALQLCARRFGFGAVSLVTAAFVFCMSQYFISYQRMLVRNWDLQTTYWKQIQQCTREYKPRLLIIDLRRRKQECAARNECSTGRRPTLQSSCGNRTALPAERLSRKPLSCSTQRATILDQNFSWVRCSPGTSRLRR